VRKTGSLHPSGWRGPGSLSQKVQLPAGILAVDMGTQARLCPFVNLSPASRSWGHRVSVANLSHPGRGFGISPGKGL
jgi:hypothetical protein